MKILIDDKMQYSTDAPDELISPALSDTYEDETSFDITLASMDRITCMGVGYTDATEITIDNNAGETRTVTITKTYPYHNGLYTFNEIYPGSEYGVSFTISHNGSYVGRIALGEWRSLCANPTMEIGFYTTTESRETLSGQVIPGAGGFHGRTVDLDIRYKIDEDIYDDIESAYDSQIMKGFPYFLKLDDEQHKLPASMLRFYASTDSPLTKLQSSTYKFLYSYKFAFVERF